MSAPPKIPHEIAIFLKEVTLPMTIAGGLVLEGWIAGDEEYQGLSPSALAGIVYSRMQRMALETQDHQGNEGQN